MKLDVQVTTLFGRMACSTTSTSVLRCVVRRRWPGRLGSILNRRPRLGLHFFGTTTAPSLTANSR